MSEVNTSLTLTGSELFSVRQGENGEVVDARFWVYAEQTATNGLAAAVRVFRLRAMTYPALGEWELEQRHTDPEARDLFPMPVSDANLGSEPLDSYIARTYLNPANPHAINEIVQFLEPADDMQPPLPMHQDFEGLALAA